MTNQKIKAYCEAEFEQIDQILDRLEQLSTEMRSSPPTLTQVAAASTFVHNIYNALENILKRVCVFRGIDVPKTQTWHRDLLNVGFEKKLVDERLYNDLLKYLSFRHYFVHSYVFNVRWEDLRPLVDEISEVSQRYKMAILKAV